MLKSVEDSVTALAKAGLPIMVRQPRTPREPTRRRFVKLYDVAIGCGAKRHLRIRHGPGTPTPEGVRNLLTFLKEGRPSAGRDVKLDYHGHNDRGLGTSNALAATAIRDRGHGSPLGSRARRQHSMDQLPQNMQLWGSSTGPIAPLSSTCRSSPSTAGATIQRNYPALGADAFPAPAPALHAGGGDQGDPQGATRALADRVYSGVPGRRPARARASASKVARCRRIERRVFWLRVAWPRGDEGAHRRASSSAEGERRLLTAEGVQQLAR